MLRTWASRTGKTREEIGQRCNTWQIHMRPEAKHGDVALSRGLTATQIEVTRVGCNTDDATSKAHNLVVLQLSLGDLPPRISAPRWSPRVARVRAALHNLLPGLAPRVTRVKAALHNLLPGLVA